MNIFSLIYFICKSSYPFVAVSPLCSRVPMRSRNGLDMRPALSQPSRSGKAFSCSLDELGLKYLNHIGEKDQTHSSWYLLQNLLVPRERRVSGHLAPNELRSETFSPQIGTIGFHLRSYQSPAAPLSEHYRSSHPTISVIFSSSANLRFNSYIGFLPLECDYRFLMSV